MRPARTATTPARTASDFSARPRPLLWRIAKRLYWLAKAKTARLFGLGDSEPTKHYRVERYAKKSEGYTVSNKRLIVCVTHELPWPIQAGNQYRIARMIRWFLGKGYEVLVVVAPLADIPSSKRQASFQKYDNVLLCYQGGLIQQSIKTLFLSLDRLDGQPIQQIQSMDQADNPPLHEYEIRNCHDALIGVAQEIARQFPDAIWYINYAFMSRVINHLPSNVITFVDTHDVFSQKQEKVFSYGIKGEAPITAEEERRMLLRPDAVVAIQDDDADDLRRLVPDQTILTVGVDFDFATLDPPPRTPSILMVASDNPLNTKGLHDFLQFAWPSIKAAVNDVKLTLVGLIGRTVPVQDPQIVATGAVTSLDPYYECARVVINPAIAGTGLKIKAVESISHMRPIVTWPAGVAGIRDPLITLCYVVRNWDDFANTVTRLLTTDFDRELSSANYGAIQRELSTQMAYRELETWLGAILSDRCVRPLP